MKIVRLNNINYKLPNGLNEFQLAMYVHLINWKWEYITKDVGIYQKKNKNGIIQTYEYDAILPQTVHDKFPLIYPSILNDLKEHKLKFGFKFHEHFNHMASSQAANINLFLPILLNPQVNDFFRAIKPDFKNLATDELYKGFRIEFWDGNSNKEKGVLGDHSAIAGTDSDIAIAYYNYKNELCLWLIEHKLTEKEFTECGGAKSRGRKLTHNCSKSFDDIIKNKELCYYHSGKNYEYWNITESKKNFFVNHKNHKTCPFIGGMNQLWRNQLLGFALENKGLYKDVFFSVVHHPENNYLENSMKEYMNLIDNNPKFTSFTSKDVINEAINMRNIEVDDWIKWYKELYKIT